ncbi:hypothetical protein GCM10023195_50640 [Actinoallomurus liliacearum]|uniref:Uncharacterized protein n=1 Tax=Actinoallomurus liliacearum TaxID=1080073 RepID=A0ABP8TSQ4_9ACTN
MVLVLGGGWFLALGLKAPRVWAIWSEGAVGGRLVLVLLFRALLGPVARRMAGEHRALAAQERETLSVKDRLDAVNAARQTLMQSATGAVIIARVVFTATGLIYTARTFHATEQGQITDRYTKAIEQLGSDKLDVRLGGIYALERLVRDSARDNHTVYDVLAAFLREHVKRY